VKWKPWKFSFFPKTVVGKGLQVIHSPLVLVTIVIHHSLGQLSQASSRLFAVVCWVASARAVLQPTNLLAGLNNTRMSFWEGQSGQRTVCKKGCFGNPVWLSSVFRFPEFYISGNLGYQYPEISKHPWAYRRSGDKNSSKWELQQCLVKAPITISPLP
jgi:hypothetical protein